MSHEYLDEFPIARSSEDHTLQALCAQHGHGAGLPQVLDGKPGNQPVPGTPWNQSRIWGKNIGLRNRCHLQAVHSSIHRLSCHDVSKFLNLEFPRSVAWKYHTRQRGMKFRKPRIHRAVTLSNRKNMWAIGKTSIEKCDLWSHHRFCELPKLPISFYSKSWLHHPAPLARWMHENFLHLHFSVCSIFVCLAFSFATLHYGMVWFLPTQLQIAVAPCFLKLRNKFWIQFVGRSPDELSQRHAPGLSLSSVCVAKSNHRHGPMPWLPSSSIKIINYHQNRSSLTGGSCPPNRPTCGTRPSQWDHQKIQNAHGPRGQLPPVPDLQVQFYDLCARDELRWTQAMERCKRICIAAKRSQ
jgi:hypothetical protein